MRRLVFYVNLSADGMYADPDGGLDDFVPGDDDHRYANELVRDAGGGIVGRGVYDVMRYWDELDLEDPATSEVEREFAEFWRFTPKYIVSRGRPALRSNATLVEGDVVETVRRLKAEDGADLLLSCGKELFATLTAAGLIDEYRFLVHPMALGRGKALFEALESPLRLRLTGTRVFSSGSVLLEYVPAAE